MGGGFAMLASFAISIGLGWVTLLLLLSPPRDWLARVTWLAMASGIGLGISSCIYFCWLVAPVDAPAVLVAFELLLLSTGIGILYLRSPSRAPEQAVPRPLVESRGAWVLAPVLGALVSAAAYAFWLVYRAQPHGSWDAFAMYNARARFLFRGSDVWMDAFRISNLFHPDYPVLVPGAVARIWTYVGGESTLAPGLVGFCFVASTVVLLFGSLAARRGLAAATLATVLLCGLRTVQYGNDSFVLLGAQQLSDVPFAFYLLSTLCLALSGSERGAGALAAAGLSASLGAWSKNEGLLLVVIFMAVLALLRLRDGGWWFGVRGVAAAAAGAAPVVMIVVVFKLFIAPPSEIVSASNAGLMEKLLDPGRYVLVITGLLRSFGQHGGGALIAFVAAVLVLGRRSRQEMIEQVLPCLVVVGMLAGYCLVYIITPHDLAWHQQSSQLRLLTQLWPAILLCGFLMTRNPETAFHRITTGGEPASRDAEARSR